MAAGLGLGAALLAASIALPSDQSLVFFNARMALREGRPADVLRLWLLRNAVESRTHRVSAQDPDFLSLVWAALGDLGLCQDGMSADGDGAGLWPLAFHNWVVRNMNRAAPESRPPPFDAFEVGRQQRLVSLRDVLDAEELRNVEFFRTACWLPHRLLFSARQGVRADLSDRLVAARLLRFVLKHAEQTLAAHKVEGRAVIAARLFDLNLQLAELQARAARSTAREAVRAGRERGLTAAAATQAAAALPPAIAPDSEEGQILRDCLDWPAAEWMALTTDRRLSLFAQAKASGADASRLQRAALGIVDALIERREGRELEQWLAHFTDKTVGGAAQEIWSGTRGARLMSLDLATGFRERPVIALHRGVRLLGRGELHEGIKTLAYALHGSQESRADETVHGLGRRWLSFVAGQFEVSDELLASLQALAPRSDFTALLEDLAWRAAFSGDQRSFERCLAHQRGGGALRLRTERLRPLASGSTGAFLTALRDDLEAQPYAVFRFLQRFVERLEAEDGDVRRRHAKTLEAVIDMVSPFAAADGAKGAQARRAEALAQRCYAILEGLGEHALPGTSSARAAALSPTHEVFAGSVRVAPSDALPWPFVAHDVRAPSVFTPLRLRPVEWRSGAELVFGWRIEE